MANDKDNSPTATRHQPRRAARNDRKENHKAKAITKKAVSKSRSSRSKAKEKLKATLLKKVDAMDPSDAWLEQSNLLGAGLVSSPKPSPKTGAPSSPRAKRGRPSRKATVVPRAEKKFMDDIFGSDDDDDEADTADRRRLQRGDRWIPDMEHRGRPAHRPPHVAHQLWMSYCLLDDYIYRESLTPDEVVAFPLMDDVYTYQHGGPKPITPPGFRWDRHRQLVPEDNAAAVEDDDESA
ncbi:hypothetical protein F4775DRAFT_602696 [Biscogniauxia sp. FL1348]|nr:hypothetical protein F4775DRAFT_602696 [Biscogniauxia sp. FL1348]